MADHFHYGDRSNIIAFVLSTPGQEEGKTGVPAAGDTGENMNSILAHLNSWHPTLFQSSDRYYYRITNATTPVIYAAANNEKTESYDKDVTAEDNVSRVQSELQGCQIVILCGEKAKLLKAHLNGIATIITAPHLGNKGLRNKYKNNHLSICSIKKASERDDKRRLLCANDISAQLKHL